MLWEERTIGLEGVAHEEVRDIAASLKEGLSGDGRANGGELGDVLDEAPDALQAAGQQRPQQVLPIPPVLLRPACRSRCIIDWRVGLADKTCYILCMELP